MERSRVSLGKLSCMFNIEEEKVIGSSKKKLKGYELSLLGIGFTTGTGFFLGTSIAIQKSGFSVLILFVLAAAATYFVYDALASMIAKHSEKGSFRTYSKKAFGHWAGFSHGWLYWLSEMLILGSQLTALGLFARFWFPEWPLWLFSTLFAVLGVMQWTPKNRSLLMF